jgi:hypothetical protein
MPDVRDELRRELVARGCAVAGDTLSARGELYVSGANDLAAALFEFKSTVCEAVDTMYQGSWVEGLPPRFAVMPEEAADDPSFELLEQMRIIPLLYGVAGERVVFRELDAVLAEYLKG